jgi:hypothetical protein
MRCVEILKQVQDDFWNSLYSLFLSLNLSNQFPVAREISFIETIQEFLVLFADAKFHEVAVNVKLQPVAVAVFLLKAFGAAH